MENKNTSKTESTMTFKQFLLKLRDIYRPFKGVIIALFALLLLQQALNLVSPYIYGKIIDGIISEKSMASVMKLLLISFGVYIINGQVLNFVREIIETKKIDFDVSRRVTRKTLKKMLRFSIGQHENQNSGIKKSIIDRGEHSLTALGKTMIYDILPTILQVIVAVGALFFLAPVLGAIILLGVIVFIVLVIYANNILKDDLKKEEDMRHENSKKHGEILRNISLVKINAKEEEVVRKYDFDVEKANIFSKKLWIKFIIFVQARSLISNLARFSVMAVGIYFVYQKLYTPGSLVIFWSWSNNAFNELGHFSSVHRRLIEMYTSVKSYFAILDVEPDIKEIENPIVPEKIHGKIEFKNVAFGYPVREYVKDEGEKEENKTEAGDEDQKNKYVLEGVSMTIEAGQKVAIVGPSGAGKSTLVQLILRAYDPDSGHILVDGEELRNLSLNKFRSSLGIVPQDISLFDNTLKYNIMFGTSDKIDESHLVEAVKMASLDKFVSHLEKGFNTVVGERGVKLSGGERQRVGIARALVKDPSILIFDEATSSLDTENEALIRQSIEKASKGRTTIIIAHRLSTIKDADKIIVMEKGRVVGEGKHKELLKTCETYQRLINNQTVMVLE